MTQLMQAVKAGDNDRVRAFIEQGGDVNETDAAGDVPLIMAAYLGETAIVQSLLAAGADVTAVDPGMKATALHAATYAGRTEAARLLIEYGIDVDAQGPYNGYTALHDAVWQNNVETAAVILDAGADLELCSTAGETALALAEKSNRAAMAALILAAVSTRS